MPTTLWPTWIEPLAPVEVAKPPDGAWICELKFDGWRLLVFKAGDQVRALTRNQKDLTSQVPGIIDAVRRLPCERAILDGELVVLGEDGHSRFHAVRSALGARTAGKPVPRYMAFDLLGIDGEDLRESPIETRKNRLRQLVSEAGDLVRFVDYIEGHAADAFAFAMRAGIEGIVCKKAGSPYRSGTWLKVKCRQERPLVIGGYRSKGPTISEVLVGLKDNGKLFYLGSVSTGLDRVATELAPRLGGLHEEASPFEKTAAPRHPAIWVKPELRVVVKFTATSTGRMRHPSIVRLAR